MIASLRIHVERVIGRVKNASILEGTLPVTLSKVSKLANQTVQAMLVNFQPVPPVDSSQEESVKDYFASLCDEDTDYDADTELSDSEL